MIWKIDIETFGTELVIDSFESSSVVKVLAWWRLKWEQKFLDDKCNFSVYYKGKMLPFETAFDLGFYDGMKKKEI